MAVFLNSTYLRSTLLVVLVSLPTLCWIAPPAAAAPDSDGRSFDGCPLLVERFSGDCVLKLQQELNVVLPAYGLAEDSRFGPATRIAVLDYQGRHHLPADGNVGGITADTLQAEFDQRKSTLPDAPAPASTCLDQGKVTGEGGRCVDDGTVGGGKSITECLKEAAIDKVQADLLERAFTTGKFASWKEAAKRVAKIAPALDAAQAFKCGWWDLPEG